MKPESDKRENYTVKIKTKVNQVNSMYMYGKGGRS